MLHMANDSLSAGMDVNMFDGDFLLAVSAELRQRLNLGRVGAEELQGEVAAGLQGGKHGAGSSGCQHVHGRLMGCCHLDGQHGLDRKSTRLNSSHANISYAVFCLKKKKKLNNMKYRRIS